MSGHSKWATTKHKKGVLDAKRGKIFTKIVREISSAVKLGGKDINSNPRLRLAIQNAKAVNMPKENIENAISKKDNIVYENVIYEGNASCGSAFIIQCLTDNTNRTVGEIRALFNRHNGNLGQSGSVSYNFNQMGVFKVDKNTINSTDDLFLDGIEYGIENIDVDEENDCIYIVGGYENFFNIQQFLESKKISIKEANLEYIPKMTVQLTGENYEKILNFIEALENLDDVQNVFHNVQLI